MARVRNRDAAAFEALYDQYHRLVYGVAMRMLGERTAAEDITQAVFLKIWSSPTLFVSGNFTGWIIRITRNRALDVLRSKSRTNVEISEDQPDDDPLEERALAELDAARVRTALKQLPLEQRKLIELGFFGGATHEDLARTTGVPLGTVKTRIRTGLRSLRSMLQGTVTPA
jgi:RNA polymerase sigma-70 factor (ECF subfamily)